LNDPFSDSPFPFEYRIKMEVMQRHPPKELANKTANDCGGGRKTMMTAPWKAFLGGLPPSRS
jgi:hypothetical protein